WWWQQGTSGLAREVIVRLRRSPTTLVYDKRGYTEQIAEQEIGKATPRPVMKPTVTADIPGSTVGFLKALEDDDLVIFHHPQLEKAAQIATRQAFGNYGTFRFGAPKDDPEADVTPLEAAALALRYLADAPVHTKPADAFHF
ncbi:MAG: hypothetical protein WBA87_12400, partial [Microbacterium sp.]